MFHNTNSKVTKKKKIIGNGIAITIQEKYTKTYYRQIIENREYKVMEEILYV